MLTNLCSWAKSKVLSWRYKNSGIGMNHDIRATIDLRTLDHKLAYSLMMIPGLIVVVVINVVSVNATIRLAESASSWPMPLWKPDRSRRDPAAILLVLHLLIIYRINVGCLRVAGIAASGAATDGAKPTEAGATVPI